MTTIEKIAAIQDEMAKTQKNKVHDTTFNTWYKVADALFRLRHFTWDS